MDEKKAAHVFSYAIEVFDALQCKYWLARGVFRHFHLTGTIGDTQSDIDFHLLAEDRAALEPKLIEEFMKRGFVVHRNKTYKLSFAHQTTGTQVELVILFSCGDGLVYHQSRSRRLICDASLFGEKVVTIFGRQIHVPEDGYLEQIYGWDWDYIHPKVKQ